MAIPVLESLPAPLALCGSSLITKRVVSIFPRLEIKLALKKNKKLAPPLICSLWSEILSINTGNGCAELTLNQLSRLHTCWCGDWINPNVALRDTRRQRLSQACPRLVPGLSQACPRLVPGLSALVTHYQCREQQSCEARDQGVRTLVSPSTQQPHTTTSWYCIIMVSHIISAVYRLMLGHLWCLF